MTDAPLSIVTTTTGSSWTKSINIVNGYSDYGIQMAVYRGELIGIMTQTVQYPKQLFATKYKSNPGETGWRSWKSLPSAFLAQGRVSVTVLEDRFYILRRGTNDAIYLAWTDDFDTFHDAGRVGYQYARTIAAPAICAHNGQLHVAHVGTDNSLWHAVVDKGNNVITNWTNLKGTGSQSAISMEVYQGVLYLFHTGYKSTKFHWQTLADDGSWSKVQDVTSNVTSGLSATVSIYNQLFITYRGKDYDIKWHTWNGSSWSEKHYIPNVYMKYQTGLASWSGQLFVSYAADKTKSGFWEYLSPFKMMNEKADTWSKTRETDADEWDCKWDKKHGQGSLVKRWFCL